MEQESFAFPKMKRIRDPELLALIRSLPCIACRPGSQEGPTEAHHVTTRGAGGDDVVTNLMPLCGEHHRLWHMDPGKLIRAHRGIKHWLENAGRDDVLSRYRGSRLRNP